MTVKGIDVASYQSATPSVKGLAFLFTKATQGTSYVNPRMASQASTARKAGLVVGFYHFLVPGNVQKQAEYFVAKAASQEGDILACDWETDPSTGKHASCAEKDAFIKAVKKLRPTHKVVLYCNTSFWKNVDTTSYAGDGLWIAAPSDPDGKPNIKSPWVFQQIGISGTDVDIANFASAAALKLWATALVKPTPKPTPTPTPTPAPEVDVKLNDAVVLPAWIPEQWPTDKGLADKKISVNTALGSTYGHARTAREGVDALREEVAALKKDLAAALNLLNQLVSNKA